jgi:hypothetical protein
MYIVSISASTWYKWWNTTASNNNQTRMRTKEPLFRASYDNGKTFRKRVMLSTNVSTSGGAG